MSGDASTRGWGPGWPNPDTSKIVVLNLPGYGNAQSVRQELAPLVEWLIAETNRRGYRIRPEWTWGFANRPVRGTEDDPEPEPSNHSWAVALDINAPTNGMNYAGQGWAAQHAAGKTDMPKWVVDLWKNYGFFWGGDYPRRQDPMHMEWLRTPADIARYLAMIPNSKDWFDTMDEKTFDAKLAAALKPIRADLDDLHEQLIGKQTEAKDESLRQLIKEGARDAKAAAQQTRKD